MTQYFGRILNRFFLSHLAVGEKGDLRPFIKGRHFKGTTSTGGTLVKDEHDIFICEQLAFQLGGTTLPFLFCFKVDRQLQKSKDLFRCKILEC